MQGLHASLWSNLVVVFLEKFWLDDGENIHNGPRHAPIRWRNNRYVTAKLPLPMLGRCNIHVSIVGPNMARKAVEMGTNNKTLAMLLPNTAATSPASPLSELSSDGRTTRRRSRVSAEHTLNRVRENQRRHRARRQDYIATLEHRLAETEKMLTDAKAEIVALKAERDATNAMSRYTQVRVTAPNLDAQLGHLDVPNHDLTFLSDTTITSSIFLPTDTLLPTTGPPPCCSDPPTSSTIHAEHPMDPQCSTCKTRPAPAPSESTTLCAHAQVMISQQNFRNLDAETIRMWLAQGLRRARREGEGCRVENGALLRLLDYISGL